MMVLVDFSFPIKPPFVCLVPPRFHFLVCLSFLSDSFHLPKNLNFAITKGSGYMGWLVVLAYLVHLSWSHWVVGSASTDFAEHQKYFLHRRF